MQIHRLTFFYLAMAFFCSTALKAQKNEKKKLPPPEVFTAVSPDTRYFTVAYSAKRYAPGGHVFKVILKAYHIKSRRYISRIDFELAEQIEQLTFSPEGTRIWVRAGKDIFLLDIKSRSTQKKFERAAAIGFTAGDATALVAEKGHVQAYDLSTNLPVFRYEGVANEPIVELGESADQRFIYARTASKRFVFWQKRNAKPFTSFAAEELRFLPSEEKIITIGYRNRLGYITHYDANTLQKLHEFNSNDYLHYSTYTFNSGSSLSPDGKTVIFCAKRFEQTIGLGFFDALSGKPLYSLDTLALGTQFYLEEQPYHWVNDQEVLVKLKEKGAISFQLADSSQTRMSFENKFRSYRISPDGRAISSFQHDKWTKTSVLAVESTFNPEKPLREYLDNQDFLAYSPNGQFLFLNHIKENTHSFVMLSEWYQGQPLKLYPFATKPYRPGQEEEIIADAAPPEGYEHLYLQHVKPLSDLTDTTVLSVVHRTVKVRADSLEWQFHLLDQEGNYYTGLELPKYRSWICQVQLKDSAGKLTEVPSFSINGYAGTISSPLSLVLVMDHSGSMGSSRAIIVQEAAEKFIQNMQPSDTLALLKYDHKVNTESPFAHRKALLKRLQKTGLEGFGGSTALLDAAHQATRMLASLPPALERNAILFTDGYENSSTITQGELIQDARRQKVHLHTIGFGESIDEDLLKEIAQATSGSYYRIYQTPDFFRIFDDVYRKMRHYYAINLPRLADGNLTLTIKICPQGKPPLELTTKLHTFQRTIIEKPIEAIQETGFTGFDLPPVAGDVKLLNVKFVFGSDQLTGDYEAEIKRVTQYLTKHPKAKAELRGHTDSTGNEAYNQQLSEKRAKALYNRLVNAGISAKRLTAKGFGEKLPVASNETAYGRSQNRRTELVIISP